MRIEILARGGGPLANFQQNLNNLHSNISETIRSLEAANRETTNLHGGSLHSASSQIQGRIRVEEQNLAAVEALGRRTDDFLVQTMQTDAQVSRDITTEREQLFRLHPHLRPPVPPAPEPRRSGWSRFWGSVGNALSRAWNSTVNFVRNNGRRILITTLIVVGAVIAVAAVIKTGGLALVPLLAKLGMKTATAAKISKGVGVVAATSTIGSSGMNVANTWWEIDNRAFHAVRNTLGVVSIATNLTYSAGMIFNSFHKISPTEVKARVHAVTSFKRQGGYSNLGLGRDIKIEVGRDFSRKQKQLMMEDNIRRNGILRSDVTGERLVMSVRDMPNVTPPSNALNFDHILAKSVGGSNSFSNAQGIARSVNIAKSNTNLNINSMFAIPDVFRFNAAGVASTIGFPINEAIRSIPAFAWGGN